MLAQAVACLTPLACCCGRGRAARGWRRIGVDVLFIEDGDVLEFGERRTHLVHRHIQVVVGLYAHPEVRRSSEELRQLDGRLSRDRSLAAHDRMNPPRVYANRLGQSILSHTQRL